MDGFGKRLRERRLGAGMTQNQISKVTGIRIPTLSRLENGRRVPSLSSVVKLCKVLNVSADYLLGLNNA